MSLESEPVIVWVIIGFVAISLFFYLLISRHIANQIKRMEKENRRLKEQTKRLNSKIADLKKVNKRSYHGKKT
jgi:cell division protein FtsB